MISLIPLCPPLPKLLEPLRGRKVVLRIKSLEAIDEAVALSRQFGMHLHCLVVSCSKSLGVLDFRQEHRGLPLALFARKIGRFLDIAPKLPLLGQLNIRIYLPLDCEENFAGLRILSSLGIAAAAVFPEGRPIDWERTSDLMTYALMGRMPRGMIEPFHYLAQRYSPQERNDFSAVYFDDPTRYVHVDEEGRIALTSSELSEGKFVADNVRDLDSVQENEIYRESLESWRSFFLQPDGCAYCEAWRICLGKFSAHMQDGKGCSVFFKEFLEAIELYQSLKSRKGELWQP